ncbi:translation elongation factor EF-1, subunit alpha, partial [Reticulomyxa filosa]
NCSEKRSIIAFYLDRAKEERASDLSSLLQSGITRLLMIMATELYLIKNMMSGASQADVALLIVPATKMDLKPQLRKEATKRVGMNKMDDSSVNYAQDRFEKKSEIEKMLTRSNFNTFPFRYLVCRKRRQAKKKKSKTKQSNKIKAVPQIETSPLVNIQIKTTQQNITFLNIQQSRESNSKLEIFNISITKEKKR